MCPSHRFSCLWSPPYSAAQGSSRCGEKSRTVGVGPETEPVDFCAPCASNSLTAVGRTMAAGFQGTERPLSVTHSYKHALSLPDTHRPSGIHGPVERPLDLLVCISTDSQRYSTCSLLSSLSLCQQSKLLYLVVENFSPNSYGPILRENLCMTILHRVVKCV